MVQDYFVVETKVGKNVFQKQGGDTGGINSFGTRDGNYPLHKPMVNHDQNRVKIEGEQKIRDHVAGDLLEWAGGRGGDGAKPRDSQVSINLVSLASGIASYKSMDKGGQTGPPVVTLNQVNGVEVTAMFSCWGAVQRAYQILASWLRNIEAAPIVQSTIREHPILVGRTGKEGGVLRHSVNRSQ